MKLVKVAAAVLNQTPLDWERNQQNIVRAIEAARRQEVSILCMPELCITGYGCEDAFLSPGVQATALEVLQDLLPATEGMVVSLGLPLMYGGGVFNTACLVANGELLGFVGKQNLAGDGIHYEPRWFKPWPNDKIADVEIAGRTYPLGDMTFGCDGVVIGFEICEDAWVGSRPGAELAQQSVDIILNPSASHFAFGKHEIRKRFVLEGSRAFHVGYVYANLLGNESGRAIFDGDAMIANVGRMLAVGPRLSFADYHITAATLDVDATRMERARTSSFRVCIESERQHHTPTDFRFPEVLPSLPQHRAPTWELSTDRKEEEFTRAVALALFDYMRKSHSRGFVVSLSGGADSAAVATLCYCAVKLGIADIGTERFVEKLGQIQGVPEAVDTATSDDELVTRIVEKLLTCVYQATRNSSATTHDAARDLATAIGATFHVLQVDDVVQQYTNLVEGAIGESLTWDKHDITLQNIQARARAPGVWMFANLKSALLLATSNRSEAAVGYATMDGDTSGGLSPIAGIDKAFLRHWLRWMEASGPCGIGALPALHAINEQQPTAELRPQDAGQTDEDDLMPYPVLDMIERLAIRDKRMPLEIFQLLFAELPQYSHTQLAGWIDHFFRLWSRNQWKRERYAPSFHLDDENLDPKTWCRFPILSGGFTRELAQMREYVAELQPDETDPNNPELLTSVPSEIEAAALVGALADHGIEARATGGFVAGFVAEAPGEVRITVRRSDLPDAQRALSAIRGD